MTGYLIVIALLLLVLGALVWAIIRTNKNVTLVDNSNKDKGGDANHKV